MTTEDYKALAPTLPTQPGIYKYLNKEGVILYVGKAKNLKKRIASYFGNKKHATHKTRVLIKNAASISFTIVETEQDALLLESTLIKKYQPRYNVQLKDGKSYPYICIKKERFPRVFITRKVIRDGSKYYGPYTSVRQVHAILEMIRNLFPLRTCTYNLSEENINKGKFKVCLEYHIKNCEGPCENKETEAAYMDKIGQIKNILGGKFSTVKRHFQEKMQHLAENLEFEKAQNLKEKISAFEDYQGKSTVVSTTIRDVDVFSISRDEKTAFVNYLKVAHGAIIHTFTLEMTPNLNDKETDLLGFAISNLREKFNSVTQEIIVPFEVNLATKETDLIFTIPQRGDKKSLLELSAKNAKYAQFQKQKEAINNIKKQTSAERILKGLQSDLQMDDVPLHIECFDNSNIQGSNPVASAVVFKNARPSKKDYRHFHIKTVEGPNDFASMEEVVYRRYRRLLDEKQSLPQLIVIDGGKGQLHSAINSLKALDIYDKVTIIGIAKRLEEIYFAEDPVPLLLNKKSESLKLIQQLRNEAHRFAINFHRNQRSKNFTQTELTLIPGIGDKTAEKVLRHFQSVQKVKEALPSDLIEVAGKSAAMKIIQYFKDQKDQ